MIQFCIGIFASLLNPVRSLEHTEYYQKKYFYPQLFERGLKISGHSTVPLNNLANFDECCSVKIYKCIYVSVGNRVLSKKTLLLYVMFDFSFYA